MRINFSDVKKEINSLQNPQKVGYKAIDERKRVTVCELEKDGIESLNPSIFDPMVNFIAATKLEVRKTGLLYFGSVGTGKTFAAKVIASLRNYHFYVADELVRIHESNKEHFWEIIGNKEGLVIDDLDSEHIRVDYGARYELMEQAIQKRYRMWQSDKVLTIITTNLGGDEIKKRYSERIYDRLRQMCECVNASGENLREKLKGDKK